jgi:hypothetical protein
MYSYHSTEPKEKRNRSELILHAVLCKAGIEFEYQKKLPFKQCGLESETSYCLVDFVIPKKWGVILLENDEKQHSSYDAMCDVRRDFDANTSVMLGTGEKVIVIRFNPDAFTIDGSTQRTSKKMRFVKLLEVIKAWDEDPIPSHRFFRFFMFYNRTSGGFLSLQSSWPSTVQALSQSIV